MKLLAKRKSPIAMLVYDGKTWYARIFSWSHKHWKCFEELSALADNRDSIPEKILEFAKRNKAKRVRVIRPAEMHQVEMQLPDDIEPEEIHTAISSQIETDVDLQPGAARFASVRTSQFGLGGHADAIISTSFDINAITEYKAQCSDAGLTFDGIGSVELASLACQARLEPNSRFLIMRENESFYVAPENHNAPFYFQTFAFGVTPDNDLVRDQDRLDRAAKTFRRNNEHIHIWTTAELSNNRKAQIQEAFTEDVAIEYVHFSEKVTQLATHATWHNNHGKINSGCALIDAPKKPKPPYRSGTVMMIAIIVLAIAGMFLIYHKNKQNLRYKKNQIKNWNARLSERKQLASELKSLRSTQRNNRKLIRLMNQNTVPKEWMAILNSFRLSNKKYPPYTEITYIKQTDFREYEIEGVTRLDDAPNQFASIFKEQIESFGLSYSFGISEEKKGRVSIKRFVGTFAPSGGKN